MNSRPSINPIVYPLHINKKKMSQSRGSLLLFMLSMFYDVWSYILYSNEVVQSL